MALREKLRGEVLDTPWSELAPHFARQALLVVAPEVDLLDVAVAMAQDDVARVQELLATGALVRPTSDAAERWANEAPRFQAVIVQPWVVAQLLA